MPTLRDVLAAAADLDGLSAAATVAALGATVEISRDTAPKNVRDMAFYLPDDFAAVWANIEAAAEGNALVRSHLTTLASTGVNFASPMTRGLVTQLAAAFGWSNTVRDTLLSLGIVEGPRWRKAGLPQLPTEAEVTAARAALARAAALDALEQFARGVLAEWLNESVAPAHADPTAAVPTRQQFADLVQSRVGG